MQCPFSVKIDKNLSQLDTGHDTSQTSLYSDLDYDNISIHHPQHHPDLPKAVWRCHSKLSPINLNMFPTSPAFKDLEMLCKLTKHHKTSSRDSCPLIWCVGNRQELDKKMQWRQQTHPPMGHEGDRSDFAVHLCNLTMVIWSYSHTVD